MREPVDEVDLELLTFINIQLPDLPPAIFGAKPEAGRWLLGEQRFVEALASGAARDRCFFRIAQPGTPSLDLAHLPAMGHVLSRGLATAKAYEYAENVRGAAAIYTYLLKLIRHIEQDQNLTSGLANAELLEAMMIDMEGFLSREPPVEATDLLARYFRENAGPVMNTGDLLRAEGRRLARWLLEGQGTIEQRLSMLYRRRTQQYAVERIMTLKPAEQKERLREWVLEYEAHMIRLAEAVELPYREALPKIRAMDAQRDELQKGELPRGANPLIPILVPVVEKMHERFLLARAQYDMMALLSYAAHYRAQAGRWPVNLEEVAEAAGSKLPEDPYIGDAYYYKLVHIRPRIIARVPKWIAKTDHPYKMDVSRRRNVDQEVYEQAAEQIAFERSNEIMRQQRRSNQAGGASALESPVPLR
jgi:hypothetical protein